MNPHRTLARRAFLAFTKAVAGLVLFEGLVSTNLATAESTSCGQTLVSQISASGEKDAFQLTGTATGDTVTLRMFAASGGLDSFLELQDASGTVIASAAGAKLTLTLPANGPFTVIASDQGNDETGDYELFFQHLNGACGGIPLACGATVASSLSTGSRIDTYTLTGVAPGDPVTLRMTSGEPFLGEYVEIYDGSGNLVAEGSGLNVRLTLPSPGPFTILARDDNSNAPGAYEMFLQRLDDPCGTLPLSCGETRADALNTGSQVRTYQLVGVSPTDVVTLRMTSGEPFLGEYVEIYDGSGNLVTEGSGLNVRLTLPSPGPFTILARDDNSNTPGAYEMFLQRLNGPCGAMALTCGKSRGDSLDTGSEIDTFILSQVGADDTLGLRMFSDSFFLGQFLEVYDGLGALLARGPGLNLTLVPATAGPYTILARDDNSNTTGNYLLFPQRFNAPCLSTRISLNQSLNSGLESPIEIDTYEIENLQAGDLITVCAGKSGGVPLQPFVELFDGSGNPVAAARERLVVELPAMSPFLLFVRDEGFNEDGDYNLVLRGASSSCASTDDSPPTVVLAAPTTGELLSAGAPYRIEWSSADDVGVTSHTIGLSTDGGATFPTVLASGLSGAVQSLLWTIPTHLRSTRARIRVIAQDAAGAAGHATTAGDFLIFDDPPTRTIDYTYDVLNRLTGVEYSDGSTIAYGYDEVGNRVTLTSTGPVVVLADGFEAGDTGGWTGAIGSVGVTALAARTGGFGLRVDVGCVGGADLTVPAGTVMGGVYEACRDVFAGPVRVEPGPVTFRAGRRVRLGDGFSVASGASFAAATEPGLVPDAFVRDESPVGASRYGAHFAVRLDGLALAAGDRLELFTGSGAAGEPQFQVVLQRSGGENRLFLETRQDDGTYASSAASSIPVSGGWHSVALNWRASRPGQTDGRIDLVLDGVPAARLTKLSNETARIDSVRLGAAGAGAASAGFLDLDDFTSGPEV